METAKLGSAYEIDGAGRVFATSECMAVRVGQVSRYGAAHLSVTLKGQRFGHFELTPDRTFYGRTVAELADKLNRGAADALPPGYGGAR